MQHNKTNQKSVNFSNCTADERTMGQSLSRIGQASGIVLVYFILSNEKSLAKFVKILVLYRS